MEPRSQTTNNMENAALLPRAVVWNNPPSSGNVEPDITANASHTVNIPALTVLPGPGTVEPNNSADQVLVNYNIPTTAYGSLHYVNEVPAYGPDTHVQQGIINPPITVVTPEEPPKVICHCCTLPCLKRWEPRLYKLILIVLCIKIVGTLIILYS